MRKPQIVNLVLLFTVVSLVLMLAKRNQSLKESKPAFTAEQRFTVNFDYYLQQTAANTKVQWYLPQTNTRQFISDLKVPNNTPQRSDNYGYRLYWSSPGPLNFEKLSTRFEFKGRAASYDLPATFETPKDGSPEYLEATEMIQAGAPEIVQIGDGGRAGVNS